MSSEKVLFEGKISPVDAAVKIVGDFILVCILVGLYLLPRDLIRIFTTKLTVTNKKIVGKTGLFNVQRLDVPLAQVTGVSVSQNWLEQIVGSGTVTVTTAANTISLPDIDKPFAVRDMINHAIEEGSKSKMDYQAQAIVRAMNK